jgi:hypothetical protein
MAFFMLAFFYTRPMRALLLPVISVVIIPTLAG